MGMTTMISLKRLFAEISVGAAFKKNNFKFFRCTIWPQNDLGQCKWNTVHNFSPFHSRVSFSHRSTMCGFAIYCNVNCFSTSLGQKFRHQYLGGISTLSLQKTLVAKTSHWTGISILTCLLLYNSVLI